MNLFHLHVCRCSPSFPLVRTSDGWMHLVNEIRIGEHCPDEGGYDVLAVDLTEAVDPLEVGK